MLDSVFRGIFDTASTSVISVGQFILCVAVSLAIGAYIAFAASRRPAFTHSFLIALGTLPALTCVTIMMVNGNIGAGVATAGAFSLVRFRSGAGTAREIALIFMAMVTGLIAGMGYLAYAVLFTLILCAVFIVLSRLDPDARGQHKCLRITMPEDLDYSGVYNSTLDAFCSRWKVTQVKTTNMGALFRASYDIVMKPGVSEKEFIDRLRCLNGNLEIALLDSETTVSEL